MLSISLFDRTNLVGVQKAIIKAAEKGVEAATQEAVSWIKNDVITGGNYIGHQYYPDVKPATKRRKAATGKTKVLIDTSNYLSSWDGKAQGLKGVVTGGGGDSAKYSAKLYARGWKIDLLWHAEHSKEAEKIIKAAIEKAI
jgi:hypothetical protein